MKEHTFEHNTDLFCTQSHICLCLSLHSIFYTLQPTVNPSQSPSRSPSKEPSTSPSKAPSVSPSVSVYVYEVVYYSVWLSSFANLFPVFLYTQTNPTSNPSKSPSKTPTVCIHNNVCYYHHAIANLSLYFMLPRQIQHQLQANRLQLVRHLNLPKKIFLNFLQR